MINFFLCLFLLHDDIFNHLPRRLVSSCPSWTLSVPSDLSEVWCDCWESAVMVNKLLVTDPTIQQPGFDVVRHMWCVLNLYHASHSLFAANLHKRGGPCILWQVWMWDDIVNEWPPVDCAFWCWSAKTWSCWRRCNKLVGHNGDQCTRNTHSDFAVVAKTSMIWMF